MGKVIILTYLRLLLLLLFRALLAVRHHRLRPHQRLILLWYVIYFNVNVLCTQRPNSDVLTSLLLSKQSPTESPSSSPSAKPTHVSQHNLLWYFYLFHNIQFTFNERQPNSHCSSLLIVRSHRHLPAPVHPANQQNLQLLSPFLLHPRSRRPCHWLRLIHTLVDFFPAIVPTL